MTVVNRKRKLVAELFVTRVGAMMLTCLIPSFQHISMDENDKNDSEQMKRNWMGR